MLKVAQTTRRWGAGEDLALIGVKLLGQAAAGEGPPEAIEQRAQFFVLVILGMGHQARTVIESGEKEGAQHALLEAQRRTVSAIQRVLGSSVSKAFVGPFVSASNRGRSRPSRRKTR